jgi:hypothetical protein
VTDATDCPRCGGTWPGVGKARLCPSCLLGLALGADDEPGFDDGTDARAPVYQVITVLASDDDRTTYLAEQDQSRRLVALDVVRMAEGPCGDDDPGGPRDRLRALTMWGNLGVPRVIDGRRTPSGDFCVVSQYVNGPALDRYCEIHRLDGQHRVRLFARVCEIVSDGHRHGIFHGRLRPAMVIAASAHDDVVPLVLGYSVLSGRAPTVADDISGLECLARVMGWQGPTGREWDSVEHLLAAVSAEWPAGVVTEPNERSRG